MNWNDSLLAAAMAGALLGAAGCAKTQTSAGADDVAQMASDKHACKGQNACKGQGGCKTDKNECKGHNECKAQGGCKTS